MNEAFITGKVAKWARERSGYSPEELARVLRVNGDQVEAWERGTIHPPFPTAQKLAKTLRIPFGYLFLDEHPPDTAPIPDFRTVEPERRAKLSPDLTDLLNDVLLKRDWYLDQLDQAGAEPLEFVSSFTTNSRVVEVARDISERVGIGERLRREVSSWDEYLRLIVAGAEEAGVLVMRSGIVGSNTRRSLSVTEFRGFALVNLFAPLVFINAKDSKAAQIFTFAHELAHIWLGEEGVSNPDLYRRTPPNQIEQICNRIAVEVLVPAEEFKSRWNAKRGTAAEKSEELARTFRVSVPVILRRAKDSDFVGLTELFDLLTRHKEKVEALERKKAEEEDPGGGNFYNNLWARNGLKLTNALLSAARSHAINSLEAARLLNVKASTLPKLIERMAT